MMDGIFSDIKYVIIYIDDILIYLDKETPLNGIEHVVRILNNYDNEVSISECVFDVPEFDSFLFFLIKCSISSQCLKPFFKKFNEFPCPK